MVHMVQTATLQAPACMALAATLTLAALGAACVAPGARGPRARRVSVASGACVAPTGGRSASAQRAVPAATVTLRRERRHLRARMWQRVTYTCPA